MEDRELVQRIVAKDHAAFQSFVQHYQSRVFRTCYQILGNEQDAEDLAQEVFLRVYEQAAGFRGECKISTWLYRVAINLSLNRRRKQKWNRYLGPFGSPEDKESDPDSHVAAEDERPDKLLEKKEVSEILRQALDALPEKQRAAMILHKLEGLSYQQIADVLQTSLPSVESLIHRAKRNLQRRLLPFAEET